MKNCKPFKTYFWCQNRALERFGMNNLEKKYFPRS